jgi:hypothetical protein
MISVTIGIVIYIFFGATNELLAMLHRVLHG